MKAEEQKVFEIVKIVEDDVEEIVKVVYPNNVTMLEVIYSIINQNFHSIYQFVSSIVCPKSSCCGSVETKDD
jgi:hypothetical protein